ncbi:MAG: hypothetical protein ACOH2A_03785 [Sphingobacteriaceae bacterium]
MRCFIILAFGACKKDKADQEIEVGPPEDNKITYSSSAYEIQKAREWTYKLDRYPSHNTFAYFMWNGKAFDPNGNFEVGPDDLPICLFFFLTLPSGSGYMDDNFTYHELAADWSVKSLPANL